MLGRVQAMPASPVTERGVHGGFRTGGAGALETAQALGGLQPLEPELGALFHRVTRTLVRLIEPRR